MPEDMDTNAATRLEDVQCREPSYSQQAHAILERIGFPNSLPSGFDNPTIIETHISLVILGEERVLKFKKAVQFAFVDHRFLPQRWKSAVNEVILNRRITEGVYCGLQGVFGEGESAIFGSLVVDVVDEPPPVGAFEVAVVMERLANEDRLDYLISTDSVDLRKHIWPLAHTICRFHNDQLSLLDTASALRSTNAETIAAAVSENIDKLETEARSMLPVASRHALAYVARYSNAFLTMNRDALVSREKKGYVIDGHGDLRAEHVYFCDGMPRVVDCIEFNDSLRQVDVLSDLAFLRMDLDRLRRPKLSAELIKEYSAMANTEIDGDVLDFYSVYRAMVRAKVALLSLQAGVDCNLDSASCDDDRFTGELSNLEMYLALASRYAHGLNKPGVVVICGPMGVGKSTLCNFLCRLTAAPIVRSDHLRKKELGSSTKDKTQIYGEGIYSAAANERTYQLVAEAVEEELGHSNQVLVDATFSKKEHRQALRNLAHNYEVSCLFAMCTLEQEELMRRLISRSEKGLAISDGRLELLEPHLRGFEWPEASECEDVLRIDAQQSIETQAEAVLSKLSSMMHEELTKEVEEII